MMIGKALMQSPPFPPPHTVRASFLAYGVPSFPTDF
ncbi:glutamine ABC transporter permease, partial [Bacillus thuringiensis]